VFNGFTANENYELLIDKYNETVRLHVPSSTAPFVAKEEPWITPSVRIKAVAEKREAWAQYVAGDRASHVKLHAIHRNASKNVT
jgi:hypothetical protein